MEASGATRSASRTWSLKQETVRSNNFGLAHSCNSDPNHPGHENARRGSVRFHTSDSVADVGHSDMYLFSE